jgi:hypothetical protein
LVEGGIATDRAEARMRIRQTSGETDTGPTTDTRQDRHILASGMFVGHHVADDTRRGLELIEQLAGLRIDRLQVAFQGSVEYDVTGRGERAAPSGELLRIGP